MSITKFLAFDLGAESGRAIVGILDGEKIMLEEIHRFRNRQVKTGNGIYWDVPYLFKEIKRGLSLAVIKGHKEIRSIGLDTWGVDFGMLGKSGELLELPHTYRDSRTEGIPEKVFRKIPFREIYELTGIQFMKINSLYQLYSVKINNEPLLKKCDKILFISDLFNYLLTGNKKSEFTIASTSQFLNVKTGMFEERIFSALGISSEITCPVVQPGTVIGKLLPEISKETGLGDVDVRAVGCHDTASAVAAVPGEGNDWAYLSSGTWSIMGIESDVPLIHNNLNYEFTNEGGVNDTFGFSKNVTGMWLIQQVKKIWEKSGEKFTYDQIMEMAKNANSFVCYINSDDNSFDNPANMIEAIDNFCLQTAQKTPATKGEYIRSILESLALKYREVAGKLEKASGRKINKIHIVGGGSQNELLNRLTADATGRRVCAGPVEATALGNIIMQAVFAGRIESLSKARELISVCFPQKRYSPHEDGYNNWDNASTFLSRI